MNQGISQLSPLPPEGGLNYLNYRHQSSEGSCLEEGATYLSVLTLNI